MALLGNGIFGMGGIGGMGPRNASMEGLLGNFYDEDAMRSLQMKKGLLGAGIAMLGQEPSPLPINFGQSLAQGLKGGVQGAEQARDEYMGNAMTGRKMQFENEARMWDMEQQAQQKKEWDVADQERAAREAWIRSQPPEKQRIYYAFPELAGKAEIGKMFPDESGRYYGNQMPLELPNGGFGYAVQGKDGSTKALEPPIPGAKFLNPFEKAKMIEEGKTQGGMPENIVDAWTKDYKPQYDNTLSQIQAIEQAEHLIDRIQSGAMSDKVQALRGIGQQLGFEVDEAALSDTQAFQNFMSLVVIPRMQQLGGNDSNEELRYMKAASGGDITQMPAAMKMTLQLAKKLAMKKLELLEPYRREANKAMFGDENAGYPSKSKRKFNPVTGKIE